jgi:hypothetical protein
MTSISRRAFLAASTGAPIARPQGALSLREKLAAVRLRPEYHLLPPALWMEGRSREALELAAEIEPRGAVTLSDRKSGRAVLPREDRPAAAVPAAGLFGRAGHRGLRQRNRLRHGTQLSGAAARAKQLVLHVPGEGAVVRTLDVWQMCPISKDRLTS